MASSTDPHHQLYLSEVSWLLCPLSQACSILLPTYSHAEIIDSYQLQCQALPGLQESEPRSSWSRGKHLLNPLSYHPALGKGVLNRTAGMQYPVSCNHDSVLKSYVNRGIVLHFLLESGRGVNVMCVMLAYKMLPIPQQSHPYRTEDDSFSSTIWVFNF